MRRCSRGRGRRGLESTPNARYPFSGPRMSRLPTPMRQPTRDVSSTRCVHCARLGWPIRCAPRRTGCVPTSSERFSHEQMRRLRPAGPSGEVPQVRLHRVRGGRPLPELRIRICPRGQCAASRRARDAQRKRSDRSACRSLPEGCTAFAASRTRRDGARPRPNHRRARELGRPPAVQGRHARHARDRAVDLGASGTPQAPGGSPRDHAPPSCTRVARVTAGSA